MLTIEECKAAREVLDTRWEGYENAKAVIRTLLDQAINAPDLESLKREVYSFSERLKLSDGLPRYSLSEIEIKNYKNHGYNEAIDHLAPRIVRDGFVVVPEEATEEMLCCFNVVSSSTESIFDALKRQYKAMIAAAKETK